MCSDRYGLGRIIEEADLDFTEIKDEADYCDATVTGGVATVTAIHAGSDVYTVDDTVDFVRGMTVEWSVGPAADVVVEVLSPTSIQLGTSRAQAVDDTITAKPERFTCDIELNRTAPAQRSIDEILRTCNGYITYDEEGKVQIKVERTESSVAHFRDSGYDTGYGIIDGSFRWLTDDDQADREVNRVAVTFNRPDNISDEAVAHDFDHISTHALKVLEINARGIDNRYAAQRVAYVQMGKRQTLTTGASFMVGPIGLQLQPGDRIQVTHDVPNWSADDKRVLRVERIGLGSEDEFLTRLTVVDYDADIYDDKGPPRRPSSNTNAPTIVLSADTEINGSVVLTWVTTGGQSPTVGYTVYKHSATHSGAANPVYKIQGGSTDKTIPKFVYTATDAEIGSSLFFIVAAHLSPYGGVVISNEVEAIPVNTDPVGMQFVPGANSIYDGAFRHGAWIEQDPSTVTTQPDANSGAWSNPANAYDGNEATNSSATDAAGVEATTAHEWHFSAGAGAVEGRWKVKASCTPGDALNSMTLSYKDAGGVGRLFPTPVTANTYYYSPVHSASAKTDLQVGASIFRFFSGTITGRVWEIYWEENTAPWAQISNGELNLVSDGITTAEAYTPWADGTVSIPNGEEWVISLFAKSDDGPDDTLDVVMDSAGTESTLISITNTDILTTWRRYAALWTAGSALSGPHQLKIRTDSQNSISVRRVMLQRGDLVFAFNYHVDEFGLGGGAVPAFPEGDVGAFSPGGPWTGDYSSMIRIAEVS
jgi:hypothetical protein